MNIKPDSTGRSCSSSSVLAHVTVESTLDPVFTRYTYSLLLMYCSGSVCLVDCSWVWPFAVGKILLSVLIFYFRRELIRNLTFQPSCLNSKGMSRLASLPQTKLGSLRPSTYLWFKLFCVSNCFLTFSIYSCCIYAIDVNVYNQDVQF